MENDGIPVQHIFDKQHVNLDYIDLSLQASNEAFIGQLMRSAITEPFNPRDKRAPIRYQLMKLGMERHILCITSHHILVDGRSMSLFINEFRSLLHHYELGIVSCLKEMPFQYVHYAELQRASLTAEKREESLKYWRKKLAKGMIGTSLHSDERERSNQIPGNSGQQRRQLCSEELAMGRNLAQKTGVSLFIVLLSVFKIMVSDIVRTSNPIIGCNMGYRNRPEFSDNIGFFVNLMPLSTEMAENLTFKGILEKVKQTVLEAQAHAEIPFSMLAHDFRKRKTSRYQPLNLLFSHQRIGPSEIRCNKMKLRKQQIGLGMTPFTMDFLIEEGQNDGEIVVDYDARLFFETTISVILDKFIWLYKRWARDPEEPRIAVLKELQRHIIEKEQSENKRARANRQNSFLDYSIKT